MKFHYFEELQADSTDLLLKMAIGQGYVPTTCLLTGRVVMSEVQASRDPCAGCNGPRNRCHGRRKRTEP